MGLVKTAYPDYIIQSITFSVIPLSGAYYIIFWESYKQLARSLMLKNHLSFQLEANKNIRKRKWVFHLV